MATYQTFFSFDKSLVLSNISCSFNSIIIYFVVIPSLILGGARVG
ncbi:MAG: hypothetical protein Q8S84_06195 [bacterium]|nr:hypothetical protein [bacterium]MDP3381065.1 hypothetical protein [bacterium]